MDDSVKPLTEPAHEVTLVSTEPENSNLPSACAHESKAESAPTGQARTADQEVSTTAGVGGIGLWWLAWAATFLLNPIAGLCSALSALVSLLTIFDLPGILGSANGLFEMWLHIQFCWMSLAFPALLCSSLGIPDIPFFFVVFSHCVLLSLLSGSVQCSVDAAKDSAIPKWFKVVLVALTTISTIIFCPVIVPLYWLFYRFPKLQSQLYTRWTTGHQQSKFVTQDLTGLKRQWLVLVSTVVALLALSFFATLITAT